MKTQTIQQNQADTDTIVLNRQQLRKLMNDAALAALNIEQTARDFIKVNPNGDIDKLLRESIAGIAGGLIANKAFKTLN